MGFGRLLWRLFRKRRRNVQVKQFRYDAPKSPSSSNAPIASRDYLKYRSPDPIRSPAVTLDAADQLRSVMGAEFKAKAVLTKTEFRVFRLIERLVETDFKGSRVFAQTSLGEILRCDDSTAFSAINSKRVDVLVISWNGLPLAVFEYQGGEHYKGSAAARDATKKEALRKAGVSYVEFAVAETDAEIVDRARYVLARARSMQAANAKPSAGRAT